MSQFKPKLTLVPEALVFIFSNSSICTSPFCRYALHLIDTPTLIENLHRRKLQPQSAMKSLEVSRLHRQISYRCVYQRRPGNSRLQKKPKIQDNWERRSWTFMFMLMLMLMLHRGFTNDRTQNIGIFPDQTSHIWFTIAHRFKLHSIANWSRTSGCTIRGTVEVNGNLKLMTYRVTSLVNPRWSMSMNMNVHDRRSQLLNVPPFAIDCSRDVVDIHSDRRLVGGDGRLPGISWRSVAVAFFGGDFQLGLEYRSDEALYIKG
ncbi:hypothetical protein Bca4012_034227 [Brassica carinata]